ncbi:unnamed protein product, partial [Ostreobium quekettii]
NPFDQRLPEEVMLPIGKLMRLRALNLSDCGLEAVPELLTCLRSLAELNLSNNPLSNLSTSLAALVSLRTLLLRGCGLEAIPAAVCQVPSLEVLDLSNNPIRSTRNAVELLRGRRPCLLQRLILRNDNWTPELVAVACKMARLWGVREPTVA